MKKIFSQPPRIFTHRTLLGFFVTALLTFLIHPTVVNGYHLPQLDVLVWIYLAPLILSIQNAGYSPKKKFVLIFLSGLIGNYGIWFWLMTALYGFGNLNFFVAFGILTALAGALGLVFSVMLSLALWVRERRAIPWFIVLPVFMVLRDLILHHFPLKGFPWGIPPYSQGRWLEHFQWLDHTGIFGLGFFIYAINGLFLDAFSAWARRKSFHRRVLIPLTAIVFLFVVSLGLSRLSHSHFEKNKKRVGALRVVLIQGNIPQTMKWDPKKAEEIVKDYLAMTVEALRRKVDLILWPETAYPYMFDLTTLETQRFLGQKSFPAPFFIGTFSAEPAPSGKKQHNSVFHVDVSGRIVNTYHKIHLVPFGEYLPLNRYFPYLARLTQGFGYIDPGSEYPLFDVKGIRLAPMICVEDVFPRYARNFTRKGADVLVNFTNDAWYGDSSAPYDHLIYSQFRSLENRRPHIRTTNTGVTAIIDAEGKVIRQLPLFKSDYLLADLQVETGPSFYAEKGDSWIWIIVIAGVGLVVQSGFRSKA